MIDSNTTNGIPADDIDRFMEDEYGKSADSGTDVDGLQAVLEEISEWKLEGKLEDNARYFYHVNEVSRIRQGKRSFVIGRKGCGKTAIAEHLCKQEEPNTLAVKLTFKNFPFNELYALKDLGYTGPHQYITLWKFLIYNHVCQLMAENQLIEKNIRDVLHKTYVENKAPTLPRRINKWLDREFGAELFGVGINIGSPNQEEQRVRSLIDRVATLEDIVLKNIDVSTYLIVFDELDEDYRNISDAGQYDQYTALVTGLFKAVQDVRAVFSQKSSKLFPIVLLRDDIYDLIQDSDKTKWNDLRVDLDWDFDRIKELLAFRISRAIDASGKTNLNFDEAWSKLFFNVGVKIGTNGRKRIHSFEFIARSTLLRPRDFIQYLKSCCEDQLKNNKKRKITPEVIKKVDKAFSNYFRSELTDEIHGVLPDITTIFDVISQLRKWSFSVKEFLDAYNRQLKRTNLKERDSTFILQVLFLFSVIGNHPRVDREVFRYLNKEARFNFDEQVVVHRGLFKSLQIF